MSSAPAVLLAMPLWMTWTIRSVVEKASVGPLSAVSYQRLREIGGRLRADPSNVPGDIHQLVRFNVLNLDALPVAITGVALTNVRGERFTCPVSPILVAPSARYPISVEFLKGPAAVAVEVEVDLSGVRVWVPVHSLD